MKRKLDKRSLEENGITFDVVIEKNISSTHDYFIREGVAQAALVAEGLLDFEQIQFQSDLV
jgi:hypothetical protein